MSASADPSGTDAVLAGEVLQTLLAARDLLDGVILSAAGELLAGDAELLEPARELLAAAADADDIEVTTVSGAVYAARSQRHAVAIVCRRPALPSLVTYDLHLALAALDDDVRVAA
jgi:hypothetical protein